MFSSGREGLKRRTAVRRGVFEVVKRCAMGRLGRWTPGGREITTPNVAFVDAEGFPAPEWAEVVAARQSDVPRNFTLGVPGSFFVPRPAHGDVPLPDRSGLPPGLDVELPREATRGSAAVLSVVTQAPLDPEVELVVLEGGPSHLDRPKEFARTIVEARTRLGAGRILAVPGIAAPHNLGVLVYCGIDLLDSSRVAYDSARGLFHTADGAVPRDSLEEMPCVCPSCASGGPLLDHNDFILHQELAVARTAIRHGTLRELAERRAVNDPWSTAVLRELDLRHYEFQELHFPVADGFVKAYSPLALTRPDVVRFQRFVSGAYRKPPSPRVLLLLPCSARKPYAESRTHRRFREAIDACGNPAAVHEVIVTSPLGLVPRELERTYPAAHYDVPVTGDWSRDEVEMLTGALRAFLEGNRYDAVVAHVTTEAPIVRYAVPSAEFTAKERPASAESLGALTATLTRVAGAVPAVSSAQRRLEDVASLARFQFRDAGDALVAGATLRGRWPFTRILRDGKQLGMVTDRGLISLALAGGEVIAKARVCTVDIEDFVPKGNVFAVGVTGATPDVRVGSDVAVVHGGGVRAVGVARMHAREMLELRRGEAVHVRAAAG
jgi:archaeosine synthase